MVFFMRFTGDKKPEIGFISKNKINKFSPLKKFSTYPSEPMITDLNYLNTMSGGDEKFIAEMIDLFREQVEEYNELMPRLYRDEDFIGLSKLAHKAKSSVAVMGMTEVAEMLKELEVLAHDGKDTERYREMIDKFLDQSRRALEELEEHQRGT
jgi:HPt (histidine-containing phosphotransfer) domain-containing protein